MKKYQREAILISFLNKKEKLNELAEYLVHLIQDDPSLPKGSLHTITYRIKDEFRLIEKINKLNQNREPDEAEITVKNYQERIRDLLGVRIICLRLSDVKHIESHLNLLFEEKILDFVKGPERKRSFILPVTPGDTVTDGIDLNYNGYSSIHYQMTLGENSGAPTYFKGVLFELQLRTILEEAWGEIDHKYRYMRSRVGMNLPEHIHMGFYNLSAYLQVAALQAEHLCSLAETYGKRKISGAGKTPQNPLTLEPIAVNPKNEAPTPKLLQAKMVKSLKTLLGFNVTPRTEIYIEKRLGDLDSETDPVKKLKKVLTKNRLREFKAIFHEILDIEPFADKKEKNIDAINAINFGIFYELQGKRVGHEGLKAVLKWRKDHSIC